ncbi:MAG: TM2 domain-containing protein [Alkalispirochaeta sp.]|jgi:TM2 domain-containing membrane protein YozV
MKRADIGLAYLFWLPSLTGFAGLHRFYLGKPLSGLIYLVTGGLFGIGTIYDAFTMSRLVREAQIKSRFDRMLDDEIFSDSPSGTIGSRNGTPRFNPARPQSLEHSILTLAEERHGIVTPARAALAAEVSAEKARDGLDRLVLQGFADMRVSRDGLMLYIFPEFLDKAGQEELDSLT